VKAIWLPGVLRALENRLNAFGAIPSDHFTIEDRRCHRPAEILKPGEARQAD
jgi:hypothetical protein